MSVDKDDVNKGKNMRKKERKLIVTFYTTADAMAMEQICKENGVPGRLIPVPRNISAGCGLAWCAELECEQTLRKLMQSSGMKEQAMQECII